SNGRKNGRPIFFLHRRARYRCRRHHHWRSAHLAKLKSLHVREREEQGKRSKNCSCRWSFQRKKQNRSNCEQQRDNRNNQNCDRHTPASSMVLVKSRRHKRRTTSNCAVRLSAAVISCGCKTSRINIPRATAKINSDNSSGTWPPAAFLPSGDRAIKSVTPSIEVCKTSRTRFATCGLR